MRSQRAFTLIELLIVIAIVAVVLTLAAPSFRSYILMQRLKSINAQIVTDLQFARSEAASRGVPVRVRIQAVGATQLSCYILYSDTGTTPTLCDCKAAEGARCTSGPTREIRTVLVPLDLSVRVAAAPLQASNFAFDPRNGGIVIAPTDFTPARADEFSIDTSIDSARKLRSVVGQSGRVKVCVPAGSTMQGDACT